MYIGGKFNRQMSEPGPPVSALLTQPGRGEVGGVRAGPVTCYQRSPPDPTFSYNVQKTENGGADNDQDNVSGKNMVVWTPLRRCHSYRWTLLNRRFIGSFLCLGLTNIVGACLSLLYYLSNLTTVSLNLILVLFSVAMILFANMMVMLGGLKNRQQFLIPWLAVTSLSILAAIVYSALHWDDIIEYRVSRGPHALKS